MLTYNVIKQWNGSYNIIGRSVKSFLRAFLGKEYQRFLRVEVTYFYCPFYKYSPVIKVYYFFFKLALV